MAARARAEAKLDAVAAARAESEAIERLRGIEARARAAREVERVRSTAHRETATTV